MVPLESLRQLVLSPIDERHQSIIMSLAGTVKKLNSTVAPWDRLASYLWAIGDTSSSCGSDASVVSEQVIIPLVQVRKIVPFDTTCWEG